MVFRRETTSWPAHGMFAPGAATLGITTPRLAAAAGWCWTDGTFGACARREPLLWNARDARFARWFAAQGAQLVRALVAHEVHVASDEPLMLWTPDVVVLRSSMAGASVIYWTSTDLGVAFAQAIPLLADARQAAPDETGLGEVARFGGSYGERTVLRGIHRIPAAHELVMERGETRVQPVTSLHSHPDITNDEEATALIAARLEALAVALPHRRHVLFSGGVDSSLLAAIFRGQSADTVGVNLALRAGDPEVPHADAIAHRLGLSLIRDTLRSDVGELVRRIGSYASPTLDFSIIPTHHVGELARADGAATLVDGTGGDAWFGFRALANEPVWRRIHAIWPLRRMAAAAYGVLGMYRDHRAWTPLKVMARAPHRADAALAHLCAAPLYDVAWRLRRDAWDAAEDEVRTVFDRLLGGHAQEPWQRMVVVDGVFIAGGAFAGKSGQWSMVRDQETVYPFLTPALVDVARRLPRDAMLRDGDAKPLLKRLAVQAGVPREEIYRRKAGFQPPLATLLRDTRVRRYLEEQLAREHELDAFIAPRGVALVRRTLRAGHIPGIHVLYSVWNILSMRIWFDELRSGAAAARWTA